MNEQQATESPEIKRWTAKRKAQVVLDLWKGKMTVAEDLSTIRFDGH